MEKSSNWSEQHENYIWVLSRSKIGIENICFR